MLSDNLMRESVVAGNDQPSERESANIHVYYLKLSGFLRRQGLDVEQAEADGATGKLLKLSPHHLAELARDMCDELDRRECGAKTALPADSALSSKRNHARAKMADFDEKKLNRLVAEVAQEIERRGLSDAPCAASGSDGMGDQTMDAGHGKQPVAMTESLLSSVEVSTAGGNKKVRCDAPKRRTSPVAECMTDGTPISGLCTGIDSLNAIIYDIGALIDRDTDEEMENLKRRYNHELMECRRTISYYENEVIPHKNQEIARLMTGVEETDLVNARLEREVVSLTEQLVFRNQIIEDQRSAYDALRQALDQIQHDMSRRYSSASTLAREKLRKELEINDTFAEMDRHHAHIESTLADMTVAMVAANQRTCLKLLRDAATVAKAFVANFECCAQVLLMYDAGDLVARGDQHKSLYLQTLSSMLVAGKDLGTHAQSAAEFQSRLEQFKKQQDALFIAKNDFQMALKEL